MAGRKNLVDSPTFTPARYGLLSVAQIVTEGDDRWRGGIIHQPDLCETARTIADPCPPPGNRTLEHTPGVATVGADPFTVYASFVCSPVGYSEEEMTRRATAALLNGEERAVEELLWSGTTDNGVEIHPHLAENTAGTGEFSWLAATTVVTGVSVILGVTALEEALGDCYPGRGVLHVQRNVATLMARDRLLERSGATLETTLGTPVAAGAGYLGTSPAGAAPAAGTAWIYATGAVAVRRTGVEIVGDFASSLDRSVNTVARLAERTYTVTWDCCLLAALVNIA